MHGHIPVLLHEAIEGLNLRPGETVVDATLGGGGHSAKICQGVGPKGTLVAIDEDPDAFTRSEAVLKEFPCQKVFVHGNFREVSKHLTERGITNVGGILYDLGISSFHLEVSGRGFSFMRSEPLLMTLGKTIERTAYEIVNTWNAASLEEIIKEYGEEEFARSIAHAIVKRRETAPIGRSDELADIVRSAVPRWYREQRINPATKTFQAIRIATNDEVEALRDGLTSGWEALAKGGRMAVISFHSIEDRIVKVFMKERAEEGSGMIITEKPIVPSADEVRSNPRSRSAKLRIIEKILI